MDAFPHDTARDGPIPRRAAAMATGRPSRTRSASRDRVALPAGRVPFGTLLLRLPPRAGDGSFGPGRGSAVRPLLPPPARWLAGDGGGGDRTCVPRSVAQHLAPARFSRQAGAPGEERNCALARLRARIGRHDCQSSRRCAARTASVRLRTPSARNTERRWTFTVPSVMPRSRAISLFERPLPSSRRTSTCRSVRPACAAAPLPGSAGKAGGDVGSPSQHDAHRVADHVRRIALRNEAGDAEGHDRVHRARRVVGRDHHDGHRREALPQHAQVVEAAAAGHLEVHQQQVRSRLGARQRQCARAVAALHESRMGLERREGVAQRRAHERVIVGDRDQGSGQRSANVHE